MKQEHKDQIEYLTSLSDEEFETVKYYQWMFSEGIFDTMANCINCPTMTKNHKDNPIYAAYIEHEIEVLQEMDRLFPNFPDTVYKITKQNLNDFAYIQEYASERSELANTLVLNESGVRQ
jgi:hypothetical protein